MQHKIYKARMTVNANILFFFELKTVLLSVLMKLLPSSSICHFVCYTFLHYHSCFFLLLFMNFLKCLKNTSFKLLVENLFLHTLVFIFKENALQQIDNILCVEKWSMTTVFPRIFLKWEGKCFIVGPYSHGCLAVAITIQHIDYKNY